MTSVTPDIPTTAMLQPESEPKFTSIWHRPTDDADVQIVITEPADAASECKYPQRTILYVHKTILSFASPVWKAALSGKQEDEDSDVPVGKARRYFLPINHSNAKTVVALLQCIYPIDDFRFIVKELELEQLKALFDLAFQYDVKMVISKTLDRGTNLPQDADTVAFILHVDAKTNGTALSKLEADDDCTAILHQHILKLNHIQRDALLVTLSKPILVLLVSHGFAVVHNQYRKKRCDQ